MSVKNITLVEVLTNSSIFLSKVVSY